MEETRTYKMHGIKLSIVGNDFLVNLEGSKQTVEAVRGEGAPPYRGVGEKPAFTYLCPRECVFHSVGEEQNYCDLEDDIPASGQFADYLRMFCLCRYEFKHFIKKE